MDLLELRRGATHLAGVEDNIIVDLEFLKKPENALGLGMLLSMLDKVIGRQKA